MGGAKLWVSSVTRSRIVPPRFSTTWQLRQPFQKTSCSPLRTAALFGSYPARYWRSGLSPICPFKKTSSESASSSEKSNCGMRASTLS